ncbi:hypothetical protein [Legionella impletisoli]|nr:hypothetical protein [Legionella impletisoli]
MATETHSEKMRDAQEKFYDALRELEEKVNEIRIKFRKNPDEYRAAFHASGQLSNYLRTAGDAFFKDKTITQDEFLSKCNSLIQSAEPILKQHRGFGKLLEKIQAIVNFFKDPSKERSQDSTAKHGFFVPKTDSAKRVDNIREALKSFESKDSENSSGEKPKGP